jgi:hypothetical protein
MTLDIHYNTTDFFEVSAFPKRKRSILIMKLWTKHLTTAKLPKVTSILRENLPSIFSSICYNEKNLPFYKEMQNTEIGHLYEHILLEYVAQLHFKENEDQSEFVGVTSWDWKKNPRGTFKIEINIGIKDKEILLKSMKLTDNLMGKILMPLISEVEIKQPVFKPALLKNIA